MFREETKCLKKTNFNGSQNLFGNKLNKAKQIIL